MQWRFTGGNVQVDPPDWASPVDMTGCRSCDWSAGCSDAQGFLRQSCSEGSDWPSTAQEDWSGWRAATGTCQSPPPPHTQDGCHSPVAHLHLQITCSCSLTSSSRSAKPISPVCSSVFRFYALQSVFANCSCFGRKVFFEKGTSHRGSLTGGQLLFRVWQEDKGLKIIVMQLWGFVSFSRGHIEKCSGQRSNSATQIVPFLNETLFTLFQTCWWGFCRILQWTLNWWTSCMKSGESSYRIKAAATNRVERGFSLERVRAYLQSAGRGTTGGCRGRRELQVWVETEDQR